MTTEAPAVTVTLDGQPATVVREWARCWCTSLTAPVDVKRGEHDARTRGPWHQTKADAIADLVHGGHLVSRLWALTTPERVG